MVMSRFNFYVEDYFKAFDEHLNHVKKIPFYVDFFLRGNNF